MANPPLYELIRQSYRADVAQAHVVAISQHHRIQASPGYRAAARYVAGQLAAAGVQCVIRRYPANTRSRFWSRPSFQEWHCTAATLQRLPGPRAAGETLCDFAQVPTSLIQRSMAVDGEFQVVAPGGKGGRSPADYSGLDVARKLVLTREAVAEVTELAVRQRGAAGILFDGMRAGGRREEDLPDGRQYTSFWWPGPGAPDAFGFVLSPRQGQELRGELDAGGEVRVQARVDSLFYDGEIEVVEGLIPGASADGQQGSQEIVLTSHLCHPRPGANDNASGAAALLEMTATLAQLIGDGRLPSPQRGIRCLWVPEMTGTYAWLAEHETDVQAGRYLAGLNLDMVGTSQESSDCAWQIVGLPKAAAAFADHLLAWLREPLLASGPPGMRYEEKPFRGGSDHYILSDPTVGIPAPMIIQWPDRFYHTSADMPDQVSPRSLAASGALAGIYAYWLSTAGDAEARWLGHWMVARFSAQAARLAAGRAAGLRGAAPAEWRQAWTEYERQSAFEAERMASALGSLARMAPAVEAGGDIGAWRQEVEDVRAREAAWLRGLMGDSGLVPDTAAPARPAAGAETERWALDEGTASPAATEAWREQAKRWIVRRSQPGPVDISVTLETQPADVKAEYWALSEAAGPALRDDMAVMQYWADGRRTVAQIADAVGLETGRQPGEVTLRFFRLLARMGLAELLPAG